MWRAAKAPQPVALDKALVQRVWSNVGSHRQGLGTARGGQGEALRVKNKKEKSSDDILCLGGENFLCQPGTPLSEGSWGSGCGQGWSWGAGAGMESWNWDLSCCITPVNNALGAFPALQPEPALEQLSELPGPCQIPLEHPWVQGQAGNEGLESSTTGRDLGAL